jgi:hypothetical protein
MLVAAGQFNLTSTTQRHRRNTVEDEREMQPAHQANLGIIEHDERFSDASNMSQAHHINLHSLGYDDERSQGQQGCPVSERALCEMPTFMFASALYTLDVHCANSWARGPRGARHCSFILNGHYV